MQRVHRRFERSLARKRRIRTLSFLSHARIARRLEFREHRHPCRSVTESVLLAYMKVHCRIVRVHRHLAKRRKSLGTSTREKREGLHVVVPFDCKGWIGFFFRVGSIIFLCLDY